MNNQPNHNPETSKFNWLKTPTAAIVITGVLTFCAEYLFLVFVNTPLRDKFQISYSTRIIVDSIFITFFVSLTLYLLLFRRLKEGYEQKFYTLFKNAAVPAVIMSAPDYTFIDINKKFTDVFGFTKDELLGRTALEAGLVRDADAVAKIIDQLDDKGGPLTQRNLFFTKKGEPIQFLSAIPVQDDDNKKFIIATAQDISVLSKLESVLSETEQKLQLFVKYAPASIAMFDREMRYIGYSDRWLDDFGIKNRNIIGASHYDIFPEIPQRWKDVYQRCLHGATESADSDSFTRNDGHTDFVNWKALPWKTSTGEIGGIIIFSEVVTKQISILNDLVDSENRFHTLFNKSITPTALLSLPDSKFVDVNQSWVELFDYSKYEVYGKTSAEIGLTINENSWQKHLDIVKTEGEEKSLEEIALAKNGTQIPFIANVVKFQISGKDFAIMTFTDLTDIKQKEKELALRQKIA